ncbi:hypothetical protein CJ030_MR7G012061 [Morella rubra]|uniref:Gamma-glutamylcyclotransferase family protein n=1 Tax=Morella rubra TaxID=262757 RepID=A0A6A1UY93_9ROSI|nr:hypothetical protein CJ030_MR7G012061 [Morella rubra]
MSCFVGCFYSPGIPARTMFHVRTQLQRTDQLRPYQALVAKINTREIQWALGKPLLSIPLPQPSCSSIAHISSFSSKQSLKRVLFCELTNNTDGSGGEKRRAPMPDLHLRDLKQGFSNHTLMQELIRTGDAAFLGTCRTAESYPLVCGPYRVPFLLNLPGCGQTEQDGRARRHHSGHYERLPIKLEFESHGSTDGAAINTTCAAEELARAEAYYAHRSYAMEMWRKNGKKGLSAYTEKETKGYVKRKDRPQHLTLLDHIQLFLSSSSSSSP